jgi:transposase
VRVTTLLNKLLNLPGLWVQGVSFEPEGLVIHVRPWHRLLTCPACGTRVRGRFQQRRRRWRHLAIWGQSTWIEGPIHRLRCPTCQKVKTEAVPWARHDSDFTRTFEDVVGLLAQKLDRTAVAELTGISWRTVGSIAERIVAEHLHEDRFEGLVRIGIDEISYRRHHRYLTVVIDHDRQRVIWAGEGKSAATLGAFFEQLGPERAASIQLVTIDMAGGYIKAVREALEHAQIVFDRFHVARLATDAVDEVRRALMRDLDPEDRRDLRNSRWVLLKRPEAHAGYERAKLREIRRLNDALYRAYLLKETFLKVFEHRSRAAAARAIRVWLSWAARSRLEPFVKLGRTVRQHLDGILAFIDSGLANARLEGMNNKIRLLSHRAFGFHSADPLIATIYLCCSKIQLPRFQLA